MLGLSVLGSSPMTNGPASTGAGRADRLATTDCWMRRSMINLTSAHEGRRLRTMSRTKDVGPPQNGDAASTDRSAGRTAEFSGGRLAHRDHRLHSLTQSAHAAC